MGLSIIAAISENSVIGREGGLPWRLPADLRHFAALTTGHCIIMGRKTFQAIGRQLPGRTSIVLTRAGDVALPDGVITVGSLEEALCVAAANGDNEPFIIGGETLYRESLPLADRLYITVVHEEVFGDAHFPEIDWHQWRLLGQQDNLADGANPHDYSFQVFNRTNGEEEIRQHEFAPMASWKNIKTRATMLRRARDFFDSYGFTEVETPILSADTVVDRYIDPLSTAAPCETVPGQKPSMWMSTSPEFCMKRLLAAYPTPIYQITRAFRREERGAMHNPEFTMLEWYRPGDSLRSAMQFLSDLSEELLHLGPAEKISYREAFEKFADVDPHTADIEKLVEVAASHDLVAPKGLDRDGLLNFLLGELIEPNLGQDSPAILYDYPASQAALAVVRDEDPPVAERFELFIKGFELANGYHELLDADELRRRNAEINRQRVADGSQQLPEESRLLSAMEHGLPDCCGVAMGLDRMIMLACEADNIRDVLTFPIDRA